MFTRISRESSRNLRRSPTPIRLRLFGEAEAGEGDAEVAAEEVAEGGAQDLGARGPRAAFEDAVVAVEPRLRVFGVGEGLEAGEGSEGRGSPLPDVAVHVEAAVGGRARGEAADGRRAPEVHAVVAARRVGRFDSPRVAPFRVAPCVPRRGLLPLGFGREASAREARVGFRLVEADARDGVCGRERAFVEHAPLGPGARALATPVERVSPALILPPRPALFRPELAPLVTALRDEA